MNEKLNKEDEVMLKSIRVLFIAMVGMLSLMLLLTIVFTQILGPTKPELSQYRTWLIAGVAAFSFICTVLAKRSVIRAIEAAKNSSNLLSEKLMNYRSALIIYIALSELPVICCLVISFLTGDFVFQVFAAVLLGYLLAEMPKREKVLRQVEG